MNVFKNAIFPEYVESALNWILKHSNTPISELEPSFDIYTDEQILAKKIRRIYWNDIEFWERWLRESGIYSIVKKYINKPELVKHAAFLKRGKSESFIPLHQDIVLWEKELKTAMVFWVAITDAKRSNGGLFYHPDINKIYTHTLDIKHPDFKFINKETEELDYSLIKEVNADKGDVVVWGAKTAHGSFENVNGKLRVGMPLVFIEKRVQL